MERLGKDRESPRSSVHNEYPILNLSSVLHSYGGEDTSLSTICLIFAWPSNESRNLRRIRLTASTVNRAPPKQKDIYECSTLIADQ